MAGFHRQRKRGRRAERTDRAPRPTGPPPPDPPPHLTEPGPTGPGTSPEPPTPVPDRAAADPADPVPGADPAAGDPAAGDLAVADAAVADPAAGADPVAGEPARPTPATFAAAHRRDADHRFRDGERAPGTPEPHRDGTADPGSAGAAPSAASTAPVADLDEESPPADRETERGLRGLVGSGSSQVGVRAAARARDAARPTPEDIARAERELVIVRRNWVPREPFRPTQPRRRKP